MKSDEVYQLIRAHVTGQFEQFHSIARMIGANEKAAGRAVGDRIMKLVYDKPAHQLTPLPMGTRDREELVEVSAITHRLGELVLYDDAANALSRIVEEHRYAEALRENDLSPALKVLFSGPPGTGKTSAAGAIAAELKLPFVVVRHDAVVSSYLGDTASNFRKVFDFVGKNAVVALIDEFDSFGRSRQDNSRTEVGEMTRLLNAFLQQLDKHKGPSLIICATNLPDVLDEALIRRFDATVEFKLPSDSQRAELILRTVGEGFGNDFYGCHATVVRECLREKKRRVLEGCVK